jgi:hypothetical protein
MNAYELADSIDITLGKNVDVLNILKAVVVLREQADQLADLQTTIKFLEEECKVLRIQITKTIEAQEK